MTGLPMTITSFDAVFYTLAFVVPGFIGYSVFSILVPGRATDASLLRFFTFSCYNYALWAGAIYWAISRNVPAKWPTATAVAWGFVILVSPALLGLALGIMSQRDLVRRALERGGVPTIHPIPTAWDYFFSRTSPVWVLVTLSDGKTLGGFFGPRSFASSEPKERDIYLEESYRVSESGEWSRDSRDDGAWISAADIKRIDIWNEEETTHG